MEYKKPKSGDNRITFFKDNLAYTIPKTVFEAIRPKNVPIEKIDPTVLVRILYQKKSFHVLEKAVEGDKESIIVALSEFSDDEPNLGASIYQNVNEMLSLEEFEGEYKPYQEMALATIKITEKGETLHLSEPEFRSIKRQVFGTSFIGGHTYRTHENIKMFPEGARIVDFGNIEELSNIPKEKRLQFLEALGDAHNRKLQDSSFLEEAA